MLVHPSFRESASALADKLNIPLVEYPERITTGRYLQYDSDGLSLVARQHPRMDKAVITRCDFISGGVRHRRLYGGGTGQALARATGLAARFKPTIADLTAGLGRDAFVLASLGSQVIMIERNIVVAALLLDGLVRLRKEALIDEVLKPVSERLTMRSIDGKDWLQSLDKNSQPDVIYLDPMFPERNKSAKVKKEMAIFQKLVGNDEDAKGLLESALDMARYRVVVKRPRRALSLGGIKPGFSIEGKTTKYDVYPLKKIPTRAVVYG